MIRGKEFIMKNFNCEDCIGWLNRDCHWYKQFNNNPYKGYEKMEAK